MAKKKEAQMFYASKDKYLRAKELAKSPKDIKAEYLKLGGAILDHGYTPVI